MSGRILKGLEIIQRPPKIYLDTNHLSYIANIRKGQKLNDGLSEDAYRYIDNGLKSHYGLIFNPYAAIEWIEGKATIVSVSEKATVVDSAKLKYVLEGDILVYTREILDQCHQQNQNIQVSDFPIFQNLSDNSQLSSALGVLISHVPDYLGENQRKRFEKQMPFPTKVPTFSAQQWVGETFKWKQKNPEICQERINGFKAALSEDIKRQNEYFADPQQYRKDWMKRYLKIDKILKSLNPEIDIDGILGSIDITKCPAVKLYWNVREKRMKSGNPPQDNDVDDYTFLPVVPYADIVLTERNLRAFILQADRNLESKVFAKTTEAVEALKNLKCKWE